MIQHRPGSGLELCKSVHCWLLLFYSIYMYIHYNYIYILYQKDHFVPTDFGQKKYVIERPLHIVLILAAMHR